MLPFTFMVNKKNALPSGMESGIMPAPSDGEANHPQLKELPASSGGTVGFHGYLVENGWFTHGCGPLAFSDSYQPGLNAL